MEVGFPLSLLLFCFLPISKFSNSTAFISFLICSFLIVLVPLVGHWPNTADCTPSPWYLVVLCHQNDSLAPRMIKLLVFLTVLDRCLWPIQYGIEERVHD